ncbi:MAG: NTP transferase domain-containing protein [Candidatus Geothermarchaeales archaeon]
MGLTALVMAGGRCERMRHREEKPLIRVGGKAMIEYVIEALIGASRVDDIIVAVSSHTKKTAEKMKEFPVKVVETPGRGYVPDIQYAAKKLGLGKFLTMSADLPLVDGELIDRIIEHYERCGKPALSVVTPTPVFERLKLKPKYAFEAKGKIVTPIGINIIDGGKIDEPEIEEEILILEHEELALGVNTVEDLGLVEQKLSEKSKRL